LYFGDNLKVLDEEIGDGTVDLVYLDPPFNSSATYNVLFAEKSGERSAAQIAVFEDTWHWGTEAEAAYHETIHEGGKVADLLQAFRAFLGQNDMMAYLVMMAPRLKALWQALKPGGASTSIAIHYLKLLLDAVFGVENYRNEIVWKRTNAHNDSKTWSRVDDLIFFYTKSSEFTWNTPRTAFDGLYRIEV
jgi:site-specific DNA-methyltransferase (adenine-specific)